MNVNNRKLFANRDARRRLADMGGIVASSPELMGAAQKFQMGGEARYMNPNDRLNTLMNSPYVLQQADMLNMTPQDFIGSLSPARSTQLIEASIANQRDLAAMPEPEPTVAEGPVPVLEPDALRYVTGPGFAQPDFPTPEEEAANAEARARAEAELAARRAERRAAIAERNASTAEAAGRDDAEELRARADAAAAEAAALAGEVPERATPTVLTPETPADDTGPTPETPADDTGPTPEAPLDTDTLTAAVNAEGDPAQNFSNALGISGSVEERISQYEALFGRMFGQDDEEKNRERWMNMAMIGFAIAAGEDPSALKNIADGLLQGAQVSREDMATRRQRQDRIQELAVAAGLEDERLARRIAAQGSGSRDPRAAVDFWQDRYNSTMEALDNGLVALPEGMTRDQYASEQANAALEAARERFPGYATGASSLATTGNDDPAQILAEARIALAANPDNRAEIERRLEAVGIDPGEL